MRSRLLLVGPLMLVAVLAATGDRASAQGAPAPAGHQHPGTSQMGTMPPHDMGAMMAEHTAHLDALMKQVNDAATTAAKVDALTKVVAAMVEHQKMCAQMMAPPAPPAK